MFVITTKEENIVIAFGELIDYLDNGYPMLVNENIAFPIDYVNVYEIEEFPEEIIDGKYCYTSEKGFYDNPNWIDPDPGNVYGINDIVYHQIIDDYTNMLIEEGVIG